MRLAIVGVLIIGQTDFKLLLCRSNRQNTSYRNRVVGCSIFVFTISIRLCYAPGKVLRIDCCIASCFCALDNYIAKCKFLACDNALEFVCLFRCTAVRRCQSQRLHSIIISFCLRTCNSYHCRFDRQLCSCCRRILVVRVRRTNVDCKAVRYIRRRQSTKIINPCRFTLFNGLRILIRCSATLRCACCSLCVGMRLAIVGVLIIGQTDFKLLLCRINRQITSYRNRVVVCSIFVFAISISLCYAPCKVLRINCRIASCLCALDNYIAKCKFLTCDNTLEFVCLFCCTAVRCCQSQRLHGIIISFCLRPCNSYHCRFDRQIALCIGDRVVARRFSIYSNRCCAHYDLLIIRYNCSGRIELDVLFLSVQLDARQLVTTLQAGYCDLPTDVSIRLVSLVVFALKCAVVRVLLINCRNRQLRRFYCQIALCIGDRVVARRNAIYSNRRCARYDLLIILYNCSGRIELDVRFTSIERDARKLVATHQAGNFDLPADVSICIISLVLFTLKCAVVRVLLINCRDRQLRRFDCQIALCIGYCVVACSSSIYSNHRCARYDLLIIRYNCPNCIELDVRFPSIERNARQLVTTLQAVYCDFLADVSI